MADEQTTAVVQRYLDALAGEKSPEPIVRALLDRSVRRLQLVCSRPQTVRQFFAFLLLTLTFGCIRY